ncbi:MAG TPA: alpha/beta hydrolase [Actinophytocola sp.]|nr:alpha/beta hydrolase [Actinophytocola sp.]
MHSSDPVVLLHAFPLDSRMWDGLRPALGDRLVTPDLPGFGGAPAAGGPDLRLAAWGVLATLDRLGIARAIVGGCSMGGYVAMALRRIAPSRISGLVLVNTKASADTEAARTNRFAMAARAEADGIGWLADEMRTTLLGATTLASRPAVEATVRGLIADQPPAAVAWAQRAMAARPDSLDVLREADIPALVLRGEEDALIPRDEAAAMAAALPKATFVELAGAGHLAPLEIPDEFAGALGNWLGA